MRRPDIMSSDSHRELNANNWCFSENVCEGSKKTIRSLPETLGEQLPQNDSLMTCWSKNSFLPIDIDLFSRSSWGGFATVKQTELSEN